MDKIHENTHVLYMKAWKHACFYVFSPFSAYFSPHYIVVEKGLLNPRNLVSITRTLLASVSNLWWATWAEHTMSDWTGDTGVWRTSQVLFEYEVGSCCCGYIPALEVWKNWFFFLESQCLHVCDECMYSWVYVYNWLIFDPLFSNLATDKDCVIS